jgi:biopolymer transport protein ExbB
MSNSIGELFIRGGWVMWPLLAFSILTWTIVLERAFVYLTLKPRLSKLTQSIVQSLQAGDAAAARQLCHTERPYIAEIFLSAMDTQRPRDYVERVTERGRIRMMAYLKKHLWVLGTIASASPFIGLLGTVVGIVRAFHDMAEKGAGGFSVVAGGISEALVATAAGLIVAIVAVLMYNDFVTAANQTLSGLKLTLEELIDYTHEKQAKTPA